MMKSRASCAASSEISFPTSSPALYRATFGRTKGNTIGKAKSMLGDIRIFPSERRKDYVTSQNLTSDVGQRTGSVKIDETSFSEDDKFHKVKNCACVRDTRLLKDPVSWVQLADIHELTIEDEEDLLTVVPPEIYMLRSLRILAIRWSRLTCITPQLGNTELTQLDFSNNKLENIDSVTNIKSLTMLNVAGNCLQTLPKNIGDLSYLRALNVSGNQLCELPSSIGELTMLNDFIATSNNLTILPNTAGGLAELRNFDVSLNKLSSLPAEIGCLEKLNTFILSSNKLSTLPDTFDKLHQLKWLLMRKNRFTEVPAILSLLPNLEVLNMNENSITTIQAPSTYIRHLLLDRNKLASLHENILACEKLESLSLEHNIIQKVPKEIYRLKSLRVLHLGENNLEQLPQDIGKLEELRHLSLNNNKIEDLPPDMESLKSLSTLNLDNTNINGGWMSAYRQGVPAILSYARSIKVRMENGAGSDRKVVSGELKLDTDNSSLSTEPQNLELVTEILEEAIDNNKDDTSIKRASQEGSQSQNVEISECQCHNFEFVKCQKCQNSQLSAEMSNIQNSAVQISNSQSVKISNPVSECQNFKTPVTEYQNLVIGTNIIWSNVDIPDKEDRTSPDGSRAGSITPPEQYTLENVHWLLREKFICCEMNHEPFIVTPEERINILGIESCNDVDKDRYSLYSEEETTF